MEGDTRQEGRGAASWRRERKGGSVMPIQRVIHPIYLNLYDHFCPACNAKLEKVRCSATVNSRSEESTHFNLSSGDTRMIGNVKLIWDELRCPFCGMLISCKEMRKLETASHVAVKRFLKRIPFFVRLKGHACPRCRTRLEFGYESMFVVRGSPETARVDLSRSDTRFVGRAEIRRYFFSCPGCGMQMPVSDVRRQESEQEHG